MLLPVVTPGPVGPVGPIDPVGPVGPATEDAAPVGPVGPSAPVGPVGPPRFETFCSAVCLVTPRWTTTVTSSPVSAPATGSCVIDWFAMLGVPKYV